MSPIQQSGIQEIQDRASFFGIPAIDIWGPTLFGCIFASFLQGIYLTQVLDYCKTFWKKDNWYIRGMVVLVTLMTLANSAALISKTVKLTVIYGGDFAYLVDLASRREEWVNSALSCMTTDIILTFLTWRCLSFARAMRTSYGKKAEIAVWALGGLLTTLLIISYVGSIGLMVTFWGIDSYLDVIDITTGNTIGPVSFWFNFTISAYTALAILIAMVMTIQLRAARSGFGASNKVIDVLLTLIIRNGVLVVLCQILEMVFYRRITSGWSAFPSTFVDRIWAITMMSVLIQPRMAQQNYHRKAEEEALRHSSAIQGNSQGHHTSDPRQATISARNPNSDWSGTSPSAPSSGGNGGLFTTLTRHITKLNHPNSGDDNNHHITSRNDSYTIDQSGSSKCLSCGSMNIGHTINGTPGVWNRGRFGSLSQYPGNGQLGVTMMRKDEGAVSFRAALMGIYDEEAEIEKHVLIVGEPVAPLVVHEEKTTGENEDVKVLNDSVGIDKGEQPGSESEIVPVLPAVQER